MNDCLAAQRTPEAAAAAAASRRRWHGDSMATLDPFSDAAGPSDVERARRVAAQEPVYLLGDLIGPEVLARLREAFSKLCGAQIAICDLRGERIDDGARAETHECGCCNLESKYTAAVRWKEHNLGFVVVLDDDPDQTTRDLADLIAEVLASICLRQARIRKRVSELTAVYDLSGLFAHEASLDDILNAAAKRVCQVMDAKASGIRLLDEETGELKIRGVYNLSNAYLNKGRITPDSSAIDTAAFRGEVVYIEDARTDPRTLFPEHARREGLVSGLCCPMTYRGRTVGVIRIYTDHVKRFSDFDVELLRAVSSQAAGAVVNSWLFAQQMELEQTQRQHEHAAEIQRRMIPQVPPPHARLRFGRVYEPSLELGGDFFDFIDLANGNIGLAIADVVGKGVPAALLMASVRAALRAHAHSIFDINEIVAQVNRHLCRDTLVSEFATLCYGVFSPDGSRFTYCNAGHNPPLLLRGDTFVSLETGGSLIGVWPEEVFDKGVLELRSGDVLVFYTDGVTEAMDFEGVAFGMERLRESIKRYRSEQAGTLANQLLWDVRRFAGLAKQADDISIVTVRVV